MNKLTKGIIIASGVLGGGQMGALASIPGVPFNMAYDLFAPVTYPVLGTISGLTGGLSAVAGAGDNPTIGEALIAAGTGLTVSCTLIPFAPLLFISRPVVTPITWTLVGAVFGGVASWGVTKLVDKE